MIKIEFPADRLDIARALGSALLNIAGPVTEGGDYEAVMTETPRWDAERYEKTGSAYEAQQGGPKQPASLFDQDEQPDGTAEVVEEAGTDPQTTPLADSPAGAPTDEKGVPFNAAYCGTAKEPFYATGKTRGQWKKKKGVEQIDYDNWYAGQLEASPKSEGVAAPDQPSAVNTAAAFSGAPQTEETADVPTDAGALMVWISEQQAAGLLTQGDVNAAYQTTGVNTADLFGDNAAPHVAAIHTFLSAKV